MITLVLSLSSCVKMQVNGGGKQEIVMNRLQTKADFPSEGVNGVFGIYAYHLPVPADSDRLIAWNPDDATAYLENVAFKYDGAVAAGWDPEANSGTGGSYPYYWPLSGSIAFTGYSPHSSQTDAITSVTYNPNLSNNPANPYLAIGFTQETDPEQMVELLYFNTMATTVDKNTGSGKVPLTFNRTMAKVSFSFKDENNYYRIDNVRVSGCINKGVFYASVLNSNWNPDLTSLADYWIQKIEEQEPQELSTNALEMNDIYPIGQILNGVYPTLNGQTGKGVSIVFDLLDKEDDSFKCEIEYKLYPYTDSEGNPKNAYLPERWAMGIHYNYVITINAEPIEFDNPSITVEAFEEVIPDTI